ncbi:MAG: UDP-glucose/GDP-mannose dehydrogenase family protein [Candidatus Eisenbacteria bacterium]|nr:UDP-glucose/GDP-mannose dehydrogenase family protein [Candidatus Eisenbacteria bacterium]
MYKICMVGTGYVGLVSGACFADFGNTVICVDKDAGKVERLKNGEIPFYEIGLDEIVARNLKEGRLSFTTDLASAVKKCEVIFIAVGTPYGKGGEADLSYVWAAAREIAQNMNGYRLIVQKSTVPVGTGAKIRDLVAKTLKKKTAFDVASNPEFLREGSAISDFMRPDRVVIGTSSQRGEDMLAGIYAPLYLNETPMVRTNVETAELIKYAANAFLATKISFINEMANLCEIVGADVKVVARGMGLDNRIGGKFLHAGAGYGGSCFPKDTSALATFSRKVGYPLRIVKATIDVNDGQRQRILDKIRRAVGPMKGKTVGVLGLSFKPNTDDVRDSVALDLIKALLRAGARIRAFDPVAMDNARAALPASVVFAEDVWETLDGADCLILATEWNEFRRLDMAKAKRMMKRPVVIDCKNVYDPKAMADMGFVHVGVGRGIPLDKQKRTDG